MKSKIPALKVNQWLPEWDKVEWDADHYRSKPNKQFMVLSMKAGDLRRLSAIYRRQTNGSVPRTEDLGIQRRHDTKRSEHIKEFVKFGYPYCDLTEHNKDTGDHETLRKPGWLPTGIVINILRPTDARMGKTVAPNDLIEVIDDPSNPNFASLLVPELGKSEIWEPQSVAPIGNLQKPAAPIKI